MEADVSTMTEAETETSSAALEATTPEQEEEELKAGTGVEVAVQAIPEGPEGDTERKADALWATDAQEETSSGEAWAPKEEPQAELSSRVVASAEASSAAAEPAAATEENSVQQKGEGPRQTGSDEDEALAMFLEAIAASEPVHLWTDNEAGCAGPSAEAVFRVIKELPFGQRLKVVGGCPELGGWNPRKAISMEWNNGHVWVAKAKLRPGTYEFKLFVASSDSDEAVYWETDAGNRVLKVPHAASKIKTEVMFGKVEAMKVLSDDGGDLPHMP
uniref:CBM20 domain-containing protein n=1 Tax=Tetraselmis sp. GSL018 TaxID=582737 RepID=A0A061RS55_9CHLO